MKRRINVSLSELKVGDQLAEDVIDAKGVRLLSAGSKISQSAINGLNKRNIEAINIYHFQELSEEQRNEKHQEIERQLNHRFRKVFDQPLMKTLKKILLDYRKQEL